MNFKRSLKFDETYLVTAFLDIVMYFFMFVCFNVWVFYIGKLANSVSPAPLNDVAAATPTQLDLLGQGLQVVVYKFVISFIILLLLWLIVWSFFKYLIWNRLEKKHFNIKNFKRFLLLNLAWLPAVGIIYTIIIYPYLIH